MTYVSEFHAQFAKESMACQSLDNDEILNVRWATEDPNPVQKVAEKRRLEDMGQEAIKAKMDPRIVDAMRAVRALEDGETLPPDDYYDDEEEQQQQQEGEEQEQHDVKRRRIEDVAEQPVQATGLLSADTLEGLKYFAEIRKRNGSAPAQQQRAPPPAPKPTGLGLAGYGSDDED